MFSIPGAFWPRACERIHDELFRYRHAYARTRRLPSHNSRGRHRLNLVDAIAVIVGAPGRTKRPVLSDSKHAPVVDTPASKT